MSKDRKKPKPSIICDKNGVRIGEVSATGFDGDSWEWQFKADIDRRVECWFDDEFEAATYLGEYHEDMLKHFGKTKKTEKWLKGKQK